MRKKPPVETIQKIPYSRRGTPILSMRGKVFTEEHKKKLSLAHMGHLPSENAIASARARTGAQSHFWKGGITEKSALIRCSADYGHWRTAVFTRDGYTCQKCGQLGGKLEGHHLWNFAECEDLRFIVENGVTLCHKCHKKFHSAFGVKGNTPDEFQLFLIMGLTRVDMDSKSIDEGSIPSRPATYHLPTKHCDNDGIASAVGECANSHGDAINV